MNIYIYTYLYIPGIIHHVGILMDLIDHLTFDRMICNGMIFNYDIGMMFDFVHAHMLHHDGIFTNIDPNKITQL